MTTGIQFDGESGTPAGVSLEDFAAKGSVLDEPAVAETPEIHPLDNPQKAAEADMAALHHVWLYDKEEESRKAVDASKYSYYATPAMRSNDMGLVAYGRDYARAYAPAAAEEPMRLAESMVQAVDDETRRATYIAELNALKASGKDTRNSYYHFIGKMVRGEVEQKHAAHAQRMKDLEAQQEQLNKELDEILLAPAWVNVYPAGFDQSMKDAGMNVDSFDRAREALMALGFTGLPGSAGTEKVIRKDALRRAVALVDGDEDAESLLVRGIALQAHRATVEGDVGVISALVEAMEGVVANTADYVVGGELEQDLEDKVVNYQLAHDIASDGDVHVRRRREARAAFDAEQVRLASFSGKVKGAVEHGRTMADEEGMSGFFGAHGRAFGQTVGGVAPWLVRGWWGVAAKGAAYLDMRGNALERTVAEAEEAGRNDVEQILRASHNRALGEAVGMTVGGSVLRGGLRMIPGVGTMAGRGVSALGLDKAIARGGVAGTLANYGLGVGAAAVDLGVVLPTATAATTGALNLYDEQMGLLDPSYSRAWEDYQEHFKQFSDPRALTDFGVNVAFFGALSMGARQKAAETMELPEMGLRTYQMMGGREEDYARARRENPLNPDAFLKETHRALMREAEEHPVERLNRALDALKVEVREEDAQAALEDKAARAVLLERCGVWAEPAENGRVKIWTEARRGEDGRVERGKKVEEVDADVAQQYLGRVSGESLRQQAAMLRSLLAQRVVRDRFMEQAGAREDLLARPMGLADFEAEAKRAAARIEELSGGDEGKLAAARAKIDPEINAEIPLGALVDSALDFKARVENAARTGELQEGEAPVSSAFVVTFTMPDGSSRSVLRRTVDASLDNVLEELGEESRRNYRRIKGEDYSDAAMGRDLLELRDWLRSHEEHAKAASAFFEVSEELEMMLRRKEPVLGERARELDHAVTEAFSRLFDSGLVMDAMEGKANLPAWVARMMSAAAVAGQKAEKIQAVGKALRDALSQGDAAFSKKLGEMYNRHRDMISDLFRKWNDPQETDYLDAWEAVIRERDELDARLGKGVATPPRVTEELIEKVHAEEESHAEEEKEREKASQDHEKEAVDDMADKPGNEGKSAEELGRERVETYADERETETKNAVNAVEDADFSNGYCVVISADGFADVRSGMVPVEKIVMSAEVPQFKRGADPATGVVHPLEGLYRPDHDPVRVWRRADGRLEIISGRHRLDYARRSGATRISCYVYDESPQRDARWARTFDLEQNIRDNQASPLEVAIYVRGENAHGRPLSDAEIREAGIDRKGSRGEAGVLLGRFADEEVITALKNGFSLDDAIRVVQFCPGDRDVQREGLRVMRGQPDETGAYNNPGSITEARRVMARFLEVKKMQAEMQGGGGQGDLFGELGFGGNLQDDEFNRFFGKYQTRRMKEISEERSFLNNLVGKKVSAAMAEKYGIDLNDVAGSLKKKLEQLSMDYERWKNPAQHSDLMEEMRGAFREENAGQDWMDFGGTAAKEPMPEDGATAHFSTESEEPWLSDKDGNRILVSELIKRVQEENTEQVKKMRNNPQYTEVLRLIDAVLAASPQDNLPPAFVYRSLNEKEIQFFKNRLGENFDLSGYEYQLIPNELRKLRDVRQRGVMNIRLTDDDIRTIPLLLDSIVEEDNVTVRSNVTEAVAGGVINVVIENPLTRTELAFRIAPKKHSRRNAEGQKTKKNQTPQLTLVSTQAFVTQSAGLAPTRPLESAPSGEGIETSETDTVKQNLLKQEFSSRDTSVNSKKTPAVFKMVGDAWKNGSVNIDIGGGKYDTLTAALQSKGVTNYIYEPYGRTANQNAYILSQLQAKMLQGDTATCSNVLNVIKESAVRANVIHQVAKAIKPEGTAYFTIYEGHNGNGRGAVSMKDCWQNNRKAETYIDEIKQYFGSVTMKGKLIIAREPKEQDTPAVWRLGGDTDAVVHFSLFSPAEASGLKALTAALRSEKGEGRFRSDTLGRDVMLAWGSAGRLRNPDNPDSKVVGASGLAHIIFTRMAHGETLDEACYTAAKAILAAVNGEINAADSSEFKKELRLDGYNTWVYLKWMQKDNAYVVTGYQENNKFTDADVRKRAMNLAKDYADEHSGGLTQLGAALERAIARVAREYKQNNADPARKLALYEPRSRFSLGGEKSAVFGEYDAQGLTYVDPADGKKKFCIDTRGVRLSNGFTRGELSSIAPGGHKDTSLKSMVAFPELWRAYPELGNMRVHLMRPKNGSPGYYGFYDPEGGAEGQYICVNVTAVLADPHPEVQLLDTLLHEAQHAIQAHEGHSNGAGSMGQKGAQRYLGRAIQQRKQLGLDDEWAKANYDFMNKLLARVNKGDKMAIESVYWLSHGEQEARFAGAGFGEGASEAGLNPMTSLARMRGVGVRSDAESWMTVPLSRNITELGGVTFGNAGSHAGVMQSRLVPVGDFYTDRKEFQIREAMTRRTRELNKLATRGERSSTDFLLEALQVANTAVNMLPNGYRFGLEPYQMWLAEFSKLAGTGNITAAANVVPMAFWQKIMRMSFENQAGGLLTQGAIPRRELEFWLNDKAAMDMLDRASEIVAEERAALEKELEAERPDAEDKDAVTQFEERLVKELGQRLGENEELRELETGLIKKLGEMKIERVLARLLERVHLKFDEYRKDRTLGRIRRVVDSVYPTPGKDGKPQKGKMTADHYRKLESYMRLMEMKRGEFDLWMSEHYPEDGEARWEDEPLDKLVTVPLYDRHGKRELKEYTVAEMNTFASYERMSAERAEAVAKAFGEFIATGRNAWDNAQEKLRQRTAAWCEPLLRMTGVLSENELSQLRKEQGLGKGFAFGGNFNVFAAGDNDVQFFDALRGVRGLGWAGDIAQRLAKADANHNFDNTETQRRLFKVLQGVGCKSTMDAADFVLEAKEERDTGIVLVEQEPNFYERESVVFRRQFLGLLQRKVDKKNFRPVSFYHALRVMMEELGVTPDMRAFVDDGKRPAGMTEAAWQEAQFLVNLEREAMDKFGAVGTSGGRESERKEFFASVFTETERARLADARKRVPERVEKARMKWQESREEGKSALAEEAETQEALNRKPLVLSKAQAAYLVMLHEQVDYTEMLRLKGYTDDVMEKLRIHAGNVLDVAYELRDIINERQPELARYYETVYGMPFPAVENYFRAMFDALPTFEAQDLMEGYGAGTAAGSGKEAVLRSRSASVNRRLDLSLDVFSMFNLVMKEQSVILNYGEIGRDLTSILNYRDGKLNYHDALERLLDKGGVAQLREWTKAINLIAPQTEIATVNAARVLGAMLGVNARGVLSLRGGTNAKQLTAVFNTLGGSDVVSGREWFLSLGRVLGRHGIISMAKMAERPELAGRFAGWGFGSLRRAVDARRGQAVDVRSEALNNAGMEALEWEDARSNVLSACVLYDAAYRKLKSVDPAMTKKELDEAAMAEVVRALGRKSQPLNFRQKALDATKMSLWKMGGMFLGSESINTFHDCVSLARRGGVDGWKRAAEVWLTHGIALQLLQAGLDALLDDEKQHKDRTLWGYVFGSLLGPLSGIPFASQGVQLGVMGLNSAFDCKVPVYACSGLMPFADVQRTLGSMKRDMKVLTGQKKGVSWEDKCLAYDDLMRTGTALVAGGAVFGKGKGAAVAYGSALTMSAIGNVLDFLLRVTRTFEADRQ